MSIRGCSRVASDEGGYALVTVLLMLALLMTLLATYFTITNIDLASTYASMRTLRGFYAAEAGINVRLKAVRAILTANTLPTGTSPNTGSGQIPCDPGNLGSGDLACVDYALQARNVSTYVEPASPNPRPIVVPRGEAFQNCSAEEYRYRIGSVSKGPESRREAVLELGVGSRRVPLFHFAVFYGKDLEVRPGASTTLSGPLHANGDLYLDPSVSLQVHGQVSAAGSIYRGAKHQNSCAASSLQVLDPDNLSELPACGAGRAELTQADVGAWGGMIRPGLEAVALPAPTTFDATPGETYWDRADLRIALDLYGPPAIQIRAADDSVNGADSATLGGCGVTSHATTMYSHRLAGYVDLLDVDVRGLLDCLHANALLATGIGDTTDGGLVIFLTVDGPASGGMNDFGVRLFGGAELASTDVLAPAVAGLTFVSDQALYVQGDYNTTNKKPAAFIADTFHVLSNAWSDANSALGLASRVATSTRVHAAVVAGTGTTGGVEGAAGQDAGGYNGGWSNLPRLHESWSAATLTYRGSWVSLRNPQHASGSWVSGAPYYDPPTYDWDFDTDFSDPAKLPPLTPRFTYVRQDLQLARFEL